MNCCQAGCHQTCLNQWVEKSSTFKCPHCQQPLMRSKVSVISWTKFFIEISFLLANLWVNSHWVFCGFLCWYYVTNDYFELEEDSIEDPPKMFTLRQRQQFANLITAMQLITASVISVWFARFRWAISFGLTLQWLMIARKHEVYVHHKYTYA